MSSLETSAVALPPAHVFADAQVRLALLPRTPGSPSVLDGAWWPRGRELAIEIPLLAADFAQRDVRIARVIYSPATWQVAPPKLRVDGHRIQLAAVRDMDPFLVSLLTTQDARIELLVIPSETDPTVAERAMALATSPQNELSPTKVLEAARLS